MKKILFLIVAILTFWVNYAQQTGGEVVISEESIQRLANKLSLLKQKINHGESAEYSFTFIENTPKTMPKDEFESYFFKEESSTETTNYFAESVSNNKEILERLTAIEEELARINLSGDLVYVEPDKDSIFISTKERNQLGTQDSFLMDQRLDSIQKLLQELTERDLQPLESFYFEEQTIEGMEKDAVVSDSLFSLDSKDINTSMILAMQMQQRKVLQQTDAKVDSLLQLNQIRKLDSLSPLARMRDRDSLDALNHRAFEAMRNQVYLLNAKLDRILGDQIDLETREKVKDAYSTTDTIVVEKTKEIDKAEKEYEARKSKYGDYFEQVFFANNSIAIEAKYDDLISDLVRVLNEEPKVDVAIDGYASKTGNPDYNQQISMKRALALKKKLIQLGIASNRILTDYRGIDFQVENLADARRLDIQLLVRR